MKKYIIPIISLFPIFSFANGFDKFGKGKYIEISAGTWYLNWEQNDKADTAVIKEPINHKFKIKNTFAQEFSLAGQWKYIRASLKYIFSEGDKVLNKKSKADQLLAKLGLKYKDYIETIFRYTKAKTSGNASGFDTKTQNTSYIEFNTDLTILNLTFYPGWIFNKYIGFGNEYINYELPQSFYIRSDGKTILRAIEAQMEWSANFITLELTNLNSIKDTRGFNFLFFITGGYAYNINVKGKSAIDPSGYGSYLKGKTAYFYRGNIGFRYNFHKYFSFEGGYRYSKYYLETEKKDIGINIYAKTTSEFSGPFAKLILRF